MLNWLLSLRRGSGEVGLSQVKLGLLRQLLDQVSHVSLCISCVLGGYVVE